MPLTPSMEWTLAQGDMATPSQALPGLSLVSTRLGRLEEKANA